MTKKRHHYVPKAYLKFFCDGNGRVRVYRKDDPDRVVHGSPDQTAFHRYYYSQPRADGDRDHESLENFFSDIEGQWPEIVGRLSRRENVNEQLEVIFNFVALQRVRVPASRDVAEALLAETVVSTLRALDAAGQLPPEPEGHDDILDHVEVTIDPHQSIHAMVEMLKGTAAVFDRIGIGALHNATGVPFLTSDNPVVWFDPSVPDELMRPYALATTGPVVLLFPVTPHLLIYGHSTMRDQFGRQGLRYFDEVDSGNVEHINRQICRFAYAAVFAQAPGQETLIRAHAATSPVLESECIATPTGNLTIHRTVFGRRRTKPKWTG